MLRGTKPVSLLCAMDSTSTSLSPLNVLGNIPTNLFWLMSKTSTWLSFPMSAGKHPVRLLLIRTNSFKVFPIWPMLPGTHPWKWLFAKTTTEAGEFPRFSGIVDVNLLLFKKIASSVLLKSSGGNSPSKSLNLRSRYLISGIDKMVVGNGPTKRLLLISSSCRSFNLEKLFGRIPQNLFEFICKSARSVNNPNSEGI